MARFQEAGHAADAAQIVWLLAHQQLQHRLLISCIIKGARPEKTAAHFSCLARLELAGTVRTWQFMPCRDGPDRAWQELALLPAGALVKRFLYHVQRVTGGLACAIGHLQTADIALTDTVVGL